MESETNPATCFSRDYMTARARFRRMAASIGAELESLPIPGETPRGEELTIDAAWFGDRNAPNVILHCSGLHGTEGWTGSAVQLYAMPRIQSLPRDVAIAYVHCINPYGMAWHRRTNAANVDLNRNFLPNGKRPGTHPLYATLDPLLNPKGPPKVDWFLLRAIAWLPKHGFHRVRQVVAGGQYTHPEGLFYGGTELQPEAAVFSNWLVEKLTSARRLVAIDVHTGLGKFGRDLVFVESDCSPELERRARDAFGTSVYVQQSEGTIYDCSGSLLSALPRLLPHARVEAFCQEFGTYVGPWVLHVLRNENRFHLHGSVDLRHHSKRLAKEAFNPRNPVWRRRVVRLGLRRLREALSLALT